MSRSGYSDDCCGWDLIRWRGAVTAATRGARGQALLKELLRVLDEMPEKKLIPNDLEDSGGGVCALGAVGRARGLKMEGLNPEDRKAVARFFDIAPALAAEIVYTNDECVGIYGEFEGPDLEERRWRYVRNWVANQIITHRFRFKLPNGRFMSWRFCGQETAEERAGNPNFEVEKLDERS